MASFPLGHTTQPGWSGYLTRDLCVSVCRLRSTGGDMRASSKRLTGLIALAAASVLVVSACSSSKGSADKGPAYSPGYAECQTKPDDCNSGARKDGGQIILALGKKLPGF